MVAPSPGSENKVYVLLLSQKCGWLMIYSSLSGNILKVHLSKTHFSRPICR